jgi:DNA-binding NtrC family response regulator
MANPITFPVEREIVEAVMRECRWNKSTTARRLGLSRTQLHERLRKYVFSANIAYGPLLRT